MEFIIGLAFLGVIVGGVVGYFFSIYVVFAFTTLVIWIIWDEMRDKPGRRRSSGALGGFLIALAVLIPFFISMWGTWVVSSWSTDWFATNTDPLVNFFRTYILK